ncbi:MULTISPECIES: hypothetical protein [unclassified Serratia (in: enterobacteria)]|uniref:hypothetical protein n=1 Tax=unclassified Serratia (in: enterobacteria) TaxID=2647522 RepID=UPI000A8FD7B2|nr:MULTISPECIES: hypothetical protein [unclassified Serratia (in: enterobacteria)]
MTEQDINQLVRGLERSRDGFMKRHGKTPEQATGKRLSQRDRELAEAFRNR